MGVRRSSLPCGLEHYIFKKEGIDFIIIGQNIESVIEHAVVADAFHNVALYRESDAVAEGLNPYIVPVFAAQGQVLREEAVFKSYSALRVPVADAPRYAHQPDQVYVPKIS